LCSMNASASLDARALARALSPEWEDTSKVTVDAIYQAARRVLGFRLAG
jgi:hypothetical protein